MANKTLWDMQDIKMIRKSDETLEITLMGVGFGVTFKHKNIKSMDAEFARLEREWNEVKKKRVQYELDHHASHKKEMAERVKLLKKQEEFMTVVKKHAYK